MGKLVDVDTVVTEIDKMPTMIDEIGAKFVEKTCLKLKIKALTPAQPVEDIRAMCGECDAWNQYKNPQSRWIPCSEPPTENDSYLVWMPFAPEGHHITVAEWCDNYWNVKTPITAWMPKPQPWEEDRNE